MPKQRKYGRNQPPPLPFHRMLKLPATTYSNVDLRGYCGPIKDQGSFGACTGFAGTSAAEWIFRAYFQKDPVFTPFYTYVKELQADGNFPNDVGSDGETLCETLIVNGCCEQYLNEDQKIELPTQKETGNAAAWRMGAYHGIADSTTALSVLADPVPWPILVGFDVYESLESDEVAETGIYNPQPGEALLGGHEVLIVGADVGRSPILRPVECPAAFLAQNSWGESFGLKGFFWMATSILDSSTTDMKIIHSGSPWK